MLHACIMHGRCFYRCGCVDVGVAAELCVLGHDSQLPVCGVWWEGGRCSVLCADPRSRLQVGGCVWCCVLDRPHVIMCVGIRTYRRPPSLCTQELQEQLKQAVAAGSSRAADASEVVGRLGRVEAGVRELSEAMGECVFVCVCALW